MAQAKKKIEKLEKWQDVRKELFSKKELKELDEEFELKSAAIKALQDSLSREVAAYMAAEDIGFNELTRRMGISTRQTSKIVHATGNLTMATIADLAAFMGKTPKIVFE